MAANYNIEIEQGESFLFHFQYLGRGSTGIDVSGYTAQMQIRRSPLSSSKSIEVWGSGGVYFSLDAVTTSFVPYGPNFYDIELVKGVTVDKILKGRFDCNREVTR